MTWLRLLTQWRERPLRTGITACGVGIGIAALFSLLSFARGYQSGIESELERLGAHVLIVPKGCPYDAASMALHGANWPCYLKESYLKEVAGVSGVLAAAPVFMGAVENQDAAPTVYVGVQSNVLALKRAWRIAGTFPSRKGGVLAGAEVQKRYDWSIGQQVTLPGLKGQRGTVEGILSATHGSEDSFIYLGLADAQKLFRHENELTHILVRLSDPNEMDNVVGRLRGCDAGLEMNVVPLTHLFRTIQSVVNSTRLLLACVALVSLLVATAGVSNTFMMAVAERTREIGVMRTLGASRADILRLVWLETMQVCVMGAAAGLLAAWLLAPVVESWARSKLPFAPTGPLVVWSWGLAGLSLGFAGVLGSVASFLPAWRAAQVPPIVAIRWREVPL